MSSPDRRVVVLTACTGLKTESSGVLLRASDFARGQTHVAAHHRRAAQRLLPAELLYRGQQHVRLMRGVEAARNGGWDVRVSIVSAGYGVVGGEELLAPYECTFKGMSAAERRAWAHQLGMPESVRETLATPAALAIVLLGDEYLDACALEPDLVLTAPTLVFCGARAALRMPPVDGLRTVVLHSLDTRRFSCGLVGLKGEVAGRLLTKLATEPSCIDVLTTGDVLAQLTARASNRLPLAELF